MAPIILSLHLLITATAAPSALQDAPMGTHIAMSVAWSAIEASTKENDIAQVFERLIGLFGALPERAATAKQWQSTLAQWRQDVHGITGVALSGHKGATLTLLVDADAAGGWVWAVVLRGAMPKAVTAPPSASPSESHGMEHFDIDGHQAFWPEGLPWGFAYHDKTLILGNRRGLQRQVRQLIGASGPGDAAKNLQPFYTPMKKGALLHGVFALSPNILREMAGQLGEFAPLLTALAGGTFWAEAGGVGMILHTNKDERAQQGVAAIMEAAGAWLGAQVAALHSAALLVRGLDGLGRRPRDIAKDYDVSWVSANVVQSFGQFKLDERVLLRPNKVVEVSAKVSHFEPLWAGMLLALGGAGPEVLRESLEGEARRQLLLLRRAQFAAKRAQGSFAACGPSPKAIPRTAEPRPQEGCFALIDTLLANRPGPKQAQVRVQLEATTQGGKLALLARALGPDGAPRVWWLDESAADIKTFSRAD